MPKKTAHKTLTVIVAVVAVLLIIIAAQPSEFNVTRSATIAAPPATIYAQINDLRKWDGWSPWAKLDPNAKHSIETPPAGVGAVMHWSGNNKVGEGSMTITESKPNERVAFRLDFARPLKGTNTAEFTLKPEGKKQTIVTWSMRGEKNFVAKAVGLVMRCEKMVGEQFDQGLANIKTLVEAPVKKKQ